ncbi:MAG: glycosyltransferase family 4 protein [Bacteroidota bacterium]
MKILQLCHRVPFPANDGGNIAMISLADALISQGAYVKMLTLNTKKHEVNLDTLTENIKSGYHLEAIKIDTDIHVWDAFLNLFSGDSYNVNRFYSTAFEEKLIRELRQFTYDVVLMESLFMTPYIKAIRENSKAKIILRAHNVEFIIWDRLAANEKNMLRRKYLSLLAQRLRKYELNIINHTDAMLPITIEDENLFRKLGCRVPMQVIPVGIDTKNYSGEVNREQELCLFHLGAMDWRPNLEGVEWFLNKCWKNIHDKFPNLKLFLAGRGFPASMMDRNDPNVKCEGEIMDSQEFMRDKQIMVVPLKSGGGMRVKIIQGMALGKTIISTTIGAEGINYTNGRNILVADTPAEILLQIEKCIVDPAACFKIGEEAKIFALANFSNEMIGRKVIAFLGSSL